MELQRFDKETWIETIWDALHDYRENNIPESDPTYDDQWDNICSAMAYISEELDCEPEMDEEPEPEKKQYPSIEGLIYSTAYYVENFRITVSILKRLIENGFTDQTWHNDIQPHFTKGSFALWIDLDPDGEYQVWGDTNPDGSKKMEDIFIREHTLTKDDPEHHADNYIEDSYKEFETVNCAIAYINAKLAK